MQDIRGRLVSMIFQDPMTCLNPTMKVGRQLTEAICQHRKLSADEASAIICRRPCMLLKTAVVRPALSVDAEKCRGCKKCMGLGCPAISVHEKRAEIDHAQCVGCGLCGQLCAFGAIGEAK